jgi:hypothetical protein
MKEKIESIFAALAERLGLTPEEVDKLAEIGCHMSFKKPISDVIVLLDKSLAAEGKLEELLVAFVSLGSVSVEYEEREDGSFTVEPA